MLFFSFYSNVKNTFMRIKTKLFDSAIFEGPDIKYKAH